MLLICTVELFPHGGQKFPTVPPRHNIIIHHILADPPPPRPVMTSFMNSPYEMTIIKAKNSQRLPKNAKSWQKLQKAAKNSQMLPKIAISCQMLPNVAKSYEK